MAIDQKDRARISPDAVSPFDDTEKHKRPDVSALVERRPLPDHADAVLPPRAPARTARILLVRFRTGSEAQLVPFGRTVAGRALDAGLQLRSRVASRQHAAIMVNASYVVIEDLGSENGTFVNGIAIDGPSVLEDGDTVSFADLSFRVEITWSEPPGR